MTHPGDVLTGHPPTATEPAPGAVGNDLPSPAPATEWLDRHITGRRLHPTWRIGYQDNPIWMNRGGPGTTGCDPRPTGVDRFRDAAGEHWAAIEPGGMWFRCEETNRGARYWTDVLTFGPLGDATTVDATPQPADHRGGNCATPLISCSSIGGQHG